MVTGLILVVLGLVLLADQGLRYTVGVAPFDSASSAAIPSAEAPIPWAPIWAALALVAGMLLLVAGSAKT
jgi:hypothetical protein